MSSPQWLKPNLSTADSVRAEARTLQKTYPGAKALFIPIFTVRLKSCPDTKHEFFRKRYGPALTQNMGFSANCKVVP